MDFETAAEQNLNCFEWLKQFDIVEYVANDRGWYTIKSVAREAIRTSLWQLDRGKKFQEIYSLLKRYFEEQANQEVSQDAVPPKKYENSDWCRYTAEAIYYALFSL